MTLSIITSWPRRGRDCAVVDNIYGAIRVLFYKNNGDANKWDNLSLFPKWNSDCSVHIDTIYAASTSTTTCAVLDARDPRPSVLSLGLDAAASVATEYFYAVFPWIWDGTLYNPAYHLCAGSRYGLRWHNNGARFLRLCRNFYEYFFKFICITYNDVICLSFVNYKCTYNFYIISL